MADVSKARLLRLKAIVGPSGLLPVSRSTWWAGVKSGRFPKPISLGPKVTCWRESDIAALIEAGVTHKPKVG